MSANLTTEWPYGIIAVSDRRLTGFASGKIQTNRSTKMIVFACADAHGTIVYNGIGMDDEGITPTDWIMSLAEKNLFDAPLTDVLSQIATAVGPRLSALQKRYGSTRSRHTFVVSPWEGDTPASYFISNYERADEPGESPKARTEVNITKSPSTKPIRITATGSYPPRRNLQDISKAIRSSLPLNRIKALCVKAVKDIAYGRNRGRGPVGSACQWAFVGPKREEVWIGLDVVGGAFAQELPCLVNIAGNIPLGGTLSSRIGGPGMLIKDAVVGLGEQAKIARYDSTLKRAVFQETACGICGSPLPGAHQVCEVCYEQKPAQSKKQLRKFARPA